MSLDTEGLTSHIKNEGKRQALEIAEAAREPDSKLPSFSGGLFMGKFHFNLIHPFPLQDPEDKKIGDDYIAKLSAFLEKNLDPDEVDETRTIPQNVIDGMKEMGIFAMKVPKKYGGLGFSQINYNRVMMLVASYCGSTAVLISAHQSIGVPEPLKAVGSEAQKNKYLPWFAEGKISAFALTEPDVGSDPAQMSTEAKLSSDGSHYVLNGKKLWCTNGPIADIIVVMANTQPKIVHGKERKQITAFILETNTPGLTVEHRCDFMGLRGIQNGLLSFKDVKVPAENVLQGEGRGLAIALQTLNTGRLTMPAACVGMCKQCLSIARRWGNERKQWGSSVGRHEEGRQKVAYIASSTFAMEAITYLTSYMADQHAMDIRIEAAMAKYFCTELAWDVVDTTLQFRGGRGYERAPSLKGRGEEPFPIERMMRDSRINLIIEGTSEIMRLFLAREALNPHLNLAKDLLSPKTSFFGKLKAGLGLMKFYSTWYPGLYLRGLKSPSFPDMGELAPYLVFSEKNSRRLAKALFHSMGKHQQKLEEKQMLLGRLINIGCELFAISSTCTYAAALVGKNPQDKTPVKLAKHFCELSMTRVRHFFRELTENDDKISNRLAEDVLNGDMKWLEKGTIWMGKKE